MKKLLSLSFVFFTSIYSLLAEIPVKNGDKIVFLGDSITAAGYNQPTGYVQLVAKGLEVNGIAIEMIGAGISGHKSNQMLERLDRDVLSKKPNWMTLSCGVNDVWHGEKGVKLEEYKKNISQIIDQAQAAGVKVMVLTSTMIKEDQSSPQNKQLLPYNEFLRSVAKEKKCLLADLNADMQTAIATARSINGHNGNHLTNDGVHMTSEGNLMMARGVLRAFGLNEKEMNQAQSIFASMPNFTSVSAKKSLTLSQKKQLEKIAIAKKVSLSELIEAEFDKSIQAFLSQNTK